MSAPWRMRIIGVLFVISGTMGLGGCAAKPVIVTKIKLVQPVIPHTLLHCAAAPVVPKIVNQASVARYIVALWQDDLQCHAHLDAVRRVLAPISLLPGDGSRR